MVQLISDAIERTVKAPGEATDLRKQQGERHEHDPDQPFAGFRAGFAHCAGPGVGEQRPGQAEAVTLQTEKDEKFVADKSGRALHMFTTDKRDTGQENAVSNCYDACVKAWPPLLATQVKVGAQLKTGIVGKIKRKDGSTQATYGGWPLYYYGTLSGQDVQGSGGEWYLVGPDGSKVENKG